MYVWLLLPSASSTYVGALLATDQTNLPRSSQAVILIVLLHMHLPLGRTREGSALLVGTIAWASLVVAALAGAFCRRRLKLDMNSKALPSSPKRFLRCSAAASLESVLVYAMICLRLSLSSGSSCWMRGRAHSSSFAAITPLAMRPFGSTQLESEGL